MTTEQTAAFNRFLATMSPAEQRAVYAIVSKFERDAINADEPRPVVSGVDVLSLAGDMNRALMESIFTLPTRTV